MKSILFRAALVFASVFSIFSSVSAGTLDDHYLSAFGEKSSLQTNSTLEKAVLLPAAESDSPPHCGTPLKHDLKRDWNLLEPATQKVLAKQLVAPAALSGAEVTLDSPTGRFRIHYTTSGTDATSSTWAQTVAQTFDNVADAYAVQNWNLAPTVSGAPYDVYLRDLATLRLYGQTTSVTPLPSSGFLNAYSSYMEIDNNFTDPLYTNATGGPYSPGQSLWITAAHEYHHAIQYGYTLFFDVWYAEATSTWYEDELYDGVNQSYNYIPNWFNNSILPLDTIASTSTGGGYGRWIFNRYLTEQHGTTLVKSSWETLAAMNSPGNNADIPMTPVLDSLLKSTFNSTLSADFFGFAKRVYQRNWSSHTADISRIHPYSPVGTVSSYPVNSSRLLAHYSFAYVKFTPSASVTTLTISLNKTSGIQTALFKKTGGTISEITANSDGSYTVSGFGSLTASDEIVLLLVNSSALDSHQVSFSTNGTPGAVTEPNAPIATGTGGGGGGCFIATAAYGSYLHPQVQILRNFRDTRLMSNAPGRAFVAWYYRFSPPVANVIADHEPLRLLVRILLTPLILIINNLLTFFLLSLAVLAGNRIRKIRLKMIGDSVTGSL
jgi:hypothetical protein